MALIILYWSLTLCESYVIAFTIYSQRSVDEWITSESHLERSNPLSLSIWPCHPCLFSSPNYLNMFPQYSNGYHSNCSLLLIFQCLCVYECTHTGRGSWYLKAGYKRESSGAEHPQQTEIKSVCLICFSVSNLHPVPPQFAETQRFLGIFYNPLILIFNKSGKLVRAAVLAIVTVRGGEAVSIG